MTSLFISYARSDRARCERVVDRLREQGFAALFVDVDPTSGIGAGTRWEQQLYGNLRRADAVVFLSSPAAIDSQWCAIELGLARALDKTVVPVLIAGRDGHPLLADVQWVDARDDEHAGVRRLCDDLVRAGLDPRNAFAWDPSRPVYPGLRAFEPEDAAVFFGRATRIDELRERMRPTVPGSDGRVVAVVGPSGVGKSSLVRAGLLPRLARTGEWLIVPPLRPADDPVARLTDSLVASGRGPQSSRSEVRDVLAGGPEPFVAWLRDRGGDDRRTLLVLDQAEELLACPDERREAFVALLGGALRSDRTLSLVMTVRAGFLEQLLTVTRLGELIDDTLLLSVLNAAELREIIAKPAQRAGLDFEPGLIDRIVGDTLGGDALPMLATTLHRLAERVPVGETITGVDYDAVGRVEGSITQQADRVMADLAKHGIGREAVLDTMVRFARVERDRPDVMRREVAHDSLTGSAPTVVDAFVDAQLLVSDESHGVRLIDVAHEALLRQWEPLRQRIDDSREDLELAQDLAAHARSWSTDHDRGYVFTGSRLRDACQRLPAMAWLMTDLDHEFVGASLRWERMRAAERYAGQAAAGALGAALGMALAFGLLLAPQLTVAGLVLLMLSYVPLGMALGLAIGGALFAARGRQPLRTLLGGVAGAVAGALVYPAAVVLSTAGASVSATMVVNGLVLGGLLGTAVCAATQAATRVALSCLAGIAGIVLIGLLGALDVSVGPAAIAGVVLGACTALGFSAAHVDDELVAWVWNDPCARAVSAGLTLHAGWGEPADPDGVPALVEKKSSVGS